MASDRDFEFGKAVNDQAINTSNNFMKAMLTINGGAVVALLAFMSGLAGKQALPTAKLATLTGPMMFFAWGVVATVSAMCLAYFTHYATVAYQFADQGSQGERCARVAKCVAHLAAIVAALASIGLFIAGMYAVQDAVGAVFAMSAK